jgi:hypothetical protein
MPIKFSLLLTSVDIDPATVRLLRHQDKRPDRDRTPYLLWRNSPADFLTYLSRQKRRVASELEGASYWAAFVATPSKETLFVGLYSAGKPSPGEIGVPNISISGAVEDKPYMVFPLQRTELLKEYEGKLVIDWGKAFIDFVQRADAQDKDILELRQPKQLEEQESDLMDQVELLQSLEGRKLLREHLIRERDPALVRQFKKRLSSFSCSVCNFEFEDVYGPIGHEFIEAHHMEPIGFRERGTQTSVDDLIAVCSNCHRMIHRQAPPYTADEVRAFMNER